MSPKTRIDKLLFEKGYAKSRERAQAYIMAGKVLVNNQKVEKSGTKVDINAEIRVKGLDHPYVSRGGLKLEKALQHFNIPTAHRIAMDVGASTGGFSDCLLKKGVSFIFAVDVGHSQLAWELIKEPRLLNIDKTNFRYLTMTDIGSFVDLIVIDVSFISLTKILPNCMNFLIRGGDIVALVKPQFEAGRKNINKGGVVNSTIIQEKVIGSVSDFAQKLGLRKHGIIDSPIQGKKSGNREFLLYLSKA